MATEEAKPLPGIQGIQVPSPFDFLKPELWEIWIKRFMRYLSVTNMSSRPNMEKINLLCYTMGEKAEEILTQVMPTIDSNTTFDVVKKKFDDYFSPKRNIVFERYKFNSRIQLEGEPVDVFITALYTLAETCEYGSLKEELIRDRIVIGIQDVRTSERLQLTSNLTVEKAIEMVRQAEIQAKEGKAIRQETVNTKTVNKISQKKKMAFQSRGSGDGKSTHNEEQKCTRCGLARHADFKKCPALKSRCRNCDKLNHWDKKCRSKKVHCVEKEEDVDSHDNNPAFLGKVNDSLTDKDFKVKMKISELEINLDFVIDTGADITCIANNCIPDRFYNKIIKSAKSILGPDGKSLSVTGYIDVTLWYQCCKAKARVYVIQGLKQNLLGKPKIKKFELISKINAMKLEELPKEVCLKFSELFKGIGQFKKELRIHLKEGAIPFSQSVPRTIAISLQPKLKKELDRLVEEGIIKPVDFPTDWCSPIVVVPKKNSDSICLCCDYSKLNNNVKRANFPILKVDIILANLKGSKIFTKLDAQAGFHQIKLHEDSQALTTFITPFGRFMFTRLPFGINCAPEYFSQMFAELLRDIPNVIVHIDDVLIHAETKQKHDETLNKVLDRLKKEGITLNKDKCMFEQKEIEFLGHKISERGIEILPDRVSAITKFPAPTDKGSLLRFLGMVNYVSKFVPNKSSVLEPLNSLLKDNTHFVWLQPQQLAFKRIKELLLQAPILAHFDHYKKIVVQADASSYGLGSALIQEDEWGNRRIVAYASRTLSSAETKYSQIEKEALALAYATEHFKEYIIGIDIILETDHRPLLQILQSKPLDELTPRLQRMRLRLMRYNYSVMFVPGKQLVLADCLSRSPVDDDGKSKDDLPEEIDCYVKLTIANLPATKTLLDKIREEQESDFICKTLTDYCLKSWPQKNKLLDGLLPYYQLRDNFSYVDHLLLYNSRIVIPLPLQAEMLSKIHQGHLGINKCRERAKQSIWWLGLSTQLKNVVEYCTKCIEEKSNLKEPFVKEDFPSRPWQKIGIDLFKLNTWYLVMFDYYSRYLEIFNLKSLTEQEVIEKCKAAFGRFGIPEVVRSDCGTQFATKFKNFAREYDFIHVTSSPKYSQSNGAAEAAVKIAKSILKKCDDVNLGLLAYRTTPLENGYSPAELMFSRKIRSTLPTLSKNLGSFVNHKEIYPKEIKRKDRQERDYNRRHRVKELSQFKFNDRVWIIDTRCYGRIVDKADGPNSYLIKTDKGGILRRNRWHPVPAPPEQNTSSEFTTSPPVIIEDNPAEEAVTSGQEPNGNNQALENTSGASSQNVEKASSNAPRRSSRNTGPPRYLKDYIVY